MIGMMLFGMKIERLGLKENEEITRVLPPMTFVESAFVVSPFFAQVLHEPVVEPFMCITWVPHW